MTTYRTLSRLALATFLGSAAFCANAQETEQPFKTAFPIVLPSDKESQKVSVVVDQGITRTRQLRSAALRAARRSMNEGEELEPEMYRRLGDAGDSNAAWKYAKGLIEDGAEENASDIAYYSSIAAGAGRIYALKPMIDAMAFLDPETEPKARKNQLIRVLYPHAWAGNSYALMAVVEYNGEDRLFGALSEATRQKILEFGGKSGGAVQLKFAVDILASREKSNAELERARTYIEAAQTSDVLAVKATAINLLPLLEQEEAKFASAE